MNGGSGIKNIKTIIFTGVLGSIFFFAGGLLDVISDHESLEYDHIDIRNDGQKK